METIQPLPTLVAELVAIGGQLTSVLDHMLHAVETGFSSPDAEPIPVVLQRLLESVLSPLGARSDEDLQVAAAILREASLFIEDNLFLWPAE